MVDVDEVEMAFTGGACDVNGDGDNDKETDGNDLAMAVVVVVAAADDTVELSTPMTPPQPLLLLLRMFKIGV